MPNTLARPPRKPGESFSISLRRSTVAGVVISLLIHLVALLFFVPHFDKESTAPPSRNALTAHIRLPSAAAPRTPPAPEVAQVEPTPPVTQPTPHPSHQPKRPPQPTRPTSRPQVLTQRGPGSPSPQAPTPAKPYKDTPLPAPFPTPQNDNSGDMQTYMKQQQAETDARVARDGSSPTIRGGNDTPTADERNSRIAANLKPQREENGIFSIRDKGVRTAVIFLRSWDDDPRSAHGQEFKVDAGLNGDVDGAIVAQVIAVIREHYPETDFHWDSHRLGKVLVKSSRKRDTAELTAFLRKEFDY